MTFSLSPSGQVTTTSYPWFLMLIPGSSMAVCLTPTAKWSVGAINECEQLNGERHRHGKTILFMEESRLSSLVAGTGRLLAGDGHLAVGIIPAHPGHSPAFPSLRW